jgi:cytochrome c oxidase subunit III
MPATATPDIEIVIDDQHGGGGRDLPPVRHYGGGDDGKKRPNRPASPTRYYTAIAIGIISVLMFFMALASAFLVRKGSPDWVPVRIPALLWFNTAVLVLSSGTLELARKRLALTDLLGFKRYWALTTALGFVFLIGQLVAWRILVGQGIYLASNPASSFFYIFTGAHAVHLLGGIGGLVYVGHRNYDRARITRAVAAEVTSYYWHFMDALWLFLLALMFLAK